MTDKATSWYAQVPAIRRRLYRNWLSRHPEYYSQPAELQHHHEAVVRRHGELYAQRIALEGCADPFIELTATELRDVQERYESQKYLRGKRGQGEDSPPANLLEYLSRDEPPRRADDPPPTPEEIARVDAVMAQWRRPRDQEPRTHQRAEKPPQRGDFPGTEDAAALV